jgi:HEAT repeat protein
MRRVEMSYFQAAFLVLFSGVVRPVLRQAPDVTTQIVEKFCAIPDDDNQTWIRERVEELRGMGEAARGALLQMSLTENHWACAQFYLAKLGERRQIPVLRSVAADLNAPSQKRRLALQYLGELNDTQSFDTMMVTIRERVNQKETLSAIVALCQLDDPRARAALRELADDSKYEYYIEFVVRGIGLQKDQDAVDVLGRVARKERSPALTNSVRHAAAISLARIGSASSRREAVNVLELIEPGLYLDDGIRMVLDILEQAQADLPPGLSDDELPQLIERVHALESRTARQ